jgi:hypothetical protein
VPKGELCVEEYDSDDGDGAKAIDLWSVPKGHLVARFCGELPPGSGSKDRELGAGGIR